MKKKTKSQADLLPEYDLDSVPVIGRGPGFFRRRPNPGKRNVTLDADVAAIFPDSAAVNQAVRLFMKTRRKQKAG